jgi:hypothetical protein
MAGDSPAGSDIAFVVARATAARRNRHRANPDYQHFTPAAIAERVVGLSCFARQSRDGWWMVGHIFDQLDDVELDVWFDPERRRIGVSPCKRVAVSLPPAPPDTPIVFDGERMKWIDRETRQVVPDPRNR